MRCSELTTRYHPRYLPLIIRYMPAVYGARELRIGHGGPEARIDRDAPWIRFPEPYSRGGHLSEDCIQWIIASVQNAVDRSLLRMAIILDDHALYFSPDESVRVSMNLPSGGLWIAPSEREPDQASPLQH